MLLRSTAYASAFISMLSAVAAQQQCHEYVLMSARGTSEPQGPSRGFPGMINTTLSTIAGGIEYDVVYPAATDLTANLGADDIVRYLNASITACPDQQYAILGYSQGAAAAALALKGFTDIGSDTFKAIKAIIVIGNPGHVANISGNVDQFGGDTTQNYTGLFYFNGALALPKVYYDNSKILDICYQGDPICADGYPNANFANHVLYGTDENVQKMGANFLISKLGGNSNGTSTPASTPSATGPSMTPSTFPGAGVALPSNAWLATGVGIVVTLLHSM